MAVRRQASTSTPRNLLLGHRNGNISPSIYMKSSSHGSHLLFELGFAPSLFFSFSTTVSMNLLPESLASFSVACILIIVCSLSSLVQVQARQFRVGGRDGWVVHPAEDYNQWAGRHRFLTNDTLLFKYKKGGDSVLLVSKDGYDKCDTHNPIKKWDDGDTVFQFDRSGPFYFISGQDGNCQNGQKLVVVVLAFKPRPLPVPPPKALPPQSSSPTPSTAPGAAAPGSSAPATSPASSTSPATTPTHAPAMGPSSLSPSPTAAPGSEPPGSSAPATSPASSTSPATTPSHAPAMGPSSLSPSPTAAPGSEPPGSSTPATSPSPSTSPATTPAHAPAMGPSSMSPSSAPTATAPASGPTAPGAPGASPPAPTTTSPTPGGSAQPSPPPGTPTGAPANVTSPPPGPSAAHVVNPLSMWSLAFLMTVLGQI
ncbi:early nodulin-like protein 18 isoform X2 [Syzygium oleosum]|uniref:early nodulin-like protein 18 isoform X2 n=1 Tax=Syzygium oleosum TaxID=219896 RepID=UPI0024BBB506|nr:early nodulin-like protein 18 isoform X2 [Syzygium oleosum]